MKRVQIAATETYQAQNGQEFEVSIFKGLLSPEHNYWLYVIQAKHDALGHKGFSVYATKEAFPAEEVADKLALTLGLAEAKSRLDQTTAKGTPMFFPVMHEGWWLM